MIAVFKLAAVLVLVFGVVVETGRYVPAPGFALAGGTLVAVYLWFLAKVRSHSRPPL